MSTKVFADETVVVPLLMKMHLPRWVLLDLASKTAGERANVAAYEPPPVAGFETWRWATRFFREDKTLRDGGWLLCDQDQVSGIRNADLGIKLVACTTDANTGRQAAPLAKIQFRISLNEMPYAGLNRRNRPPPPHPPPNSFATRCASSTSAAVTGIIGARDGTTRPMVCSASGSTIGMARSVSGQSQRFRQHRRHHAGPAAGAHVGEQQDHRIRFQRRPRFAAGAFQQRGR